MIQERSRLAVVSALAGVALLSACAGNPAPTAMIPDGYRAILEHDSRAEAPSRPVSVETMLARARGEKRDEPKGHEEKGREEMGREERAEPARPAPPPSPPPSAPPPSAPPAAAEPPLSEALATHVVRFSGDGADLTSEERLRLIMALNRLPTGRSVGARLRFGATGDKTGFAGAALGSRRALAVIQALPPEAPVVERLFRPLDRLDGVAVDIVPRRRPAAER